MQRVLLFTMLWMLWSVVARADERAVVLIYAEGDDAKNLASELKSEVPEGLKAEDGAAVASALDKRKLKNKLGASLANKKERQKGLDALAEAASGPNVAAVIAASASKPKKGPRAVSVVMVKGGEKDVTVETQANDASDRKALLQRALTPLVPAKPAPVQAPPKEKEKEPEKQNEPEKAAAAPESDELAGISRATALLFLGAQSGTRLLEYNQPATTNLRDYSLAASFNFTVGGELYPLARTRIPVARDLGLEARWARSIGIDSRIPNGPKVETWWDRFYLGGRARLRLGSGENPPLLGFSVGYGRWVFAFADAGTGVSTTSPAQRMHQLLFGVDARVPLGERFAITGGIGGGPVFIDDPWSTRFRRTSAGELLFKIGVAIPIVRHLEARASFTYDRFFFAFNSKRDDAFAAGGALEHTLFGTVEIGGWL